MATRLFEDKEHARMYALYRPTYPDSIYKKIVDFFGNENCRDTAVDVCCGSGQSTLPLTNYFRRVIGTDVSAEQIAAAKAFNYDNIDFRISASEDLSFLANKSVDLVTVASGIHWLDRVAFYTEVTRVLKPGGVLAVFGYNVPILENQHLNKLSEQFHNEFLRIYWTERLLSIGKEELPFPGWIRLDGEDIAIHKSMSVDEFIGYLLSKSMTRACLKENPDSRYIETMKQRPTYPDSIYKKIVDFCGDEYCGDTAVDVCCGSGQSTFPLINYFGRVIGTDVSAEQIAAAKAFNYDNIEFRIGAAEDLNFLENKSVDLVTVAMGLHWLDRHAFYKEVTRVLKPRGVLAVYAYNDPKLEHQCIQELFEQYNEDFLRSYWTERLLNRNKDIKLPFPGWIRLDSEDIAINKSLSVDGFIGYLASNSKYRACLKDHPDSSYHESMKQSMLEILSTESGDDAKPCVHVKWPVYLLLGKKPE